MIFYIETEPCAICSEKNIMTVFNYIRDSCQYVNPIMVYHPIIEIDLDIINDYRSRFDDFMEVIVTREDSIMIKNPWMPKYLGFYGIVTDSACKVLYAGSLFKTDFLKCCKYHFGGIRDSL